MESSKVSNILIPYTNQDSLQNLDINSKNVVQSVVKTLDNDSVVSVNDLKTRMVCIFKRMEKLSFGKLKEIYLLGEKILKIELKLLTKTLVVEIKKDAYRNKITISNRRPDMNVIEKYTNEIVKKGNIEKGDSRICYEIIKLIFKWTWGKLAANINIELRGGEYTFTITNLRTINYSQLSCLDKIHDAIHSINIDFKNSMLTFKVTRTNEYINQHESKKRRVNEW